MTPQLTAFLQHWIDQPNLRFSYPGLARLAIDELIVIQTEITRLSEHRTAEIVALNRSLDARQEALCREKIAECEALQAELDAIKCSR